MRQWRAPITNHANTDEDFEGTEHDRHWRQAAACKGMPPDLWFPPGASGGYEAKRICAGCPVREDCLQSSLLDPGTAAVGVSGSFEGIWGGAGMGLRKRLRRLLVASPHPDRMYVPFCRCPFCRARRDHFRRLDVLKRTGQRAEGAVNTNGPGARHGRAATAARGCPCVPCRHARSRRGTCQCEPCVAAREAS